MGVWRIYSSCSYSVSKHSTTLSIDKINNAVHKCLFIIVQRIRKNGMCKKTETRNLKRCCGLLFLFFCCTLNFCASSTTGISVYSGTITGKIVLSLDGSMKDLFFVRLHTLILCPNILDAQKSRDTKLKKDATNYTCRTCLNSMFIESVSHESRHSIYILITTEF